MRELTLADLQRAGAVLRRSVPDLAEVFVFGSGAVSALHQGLSAHLRRSIDVDFSPIGKPVLYFDSKFVDQYGGPESDFFAENGFYIDYVIPDLLVHASNPIADEDQAKVCRSLDAVSAEP